MTPDLDGVYYPPLYFQCTTWLQIWTVYSFHHFNFSARHDSRSGRCILSTLYFQCTTWLQIWTVYIINHFTFSTRHDSRSGRCILSTTLLSVHDMTPDLDGVYYPPLYFQCTTWLQIWTVYIIHHFTFSARHDSRSGRCILSTTLLSVHDMTPDRDSVYYPPLYFQCTTRLQIWTVYSFDHFTFSARHDSRSGRCILSTTLLSVHDMTADLDGAVYIIHHFTFSARHDYRSGRCILSTTLLSVHDMTPDLDGVYYPPLYFPCTT